MSIFAFICIFFALQAVCLVVASRSSKGIKSQDDYYLAGKKVGFFPLMMTFIATQVGGGVILGSAEEAYHFGWGVLFYPLGTAVGLMALGLGLGKRMAEFKVSTVAQVLEKIYGYPSLKWIASGVSIINMFLVLVAQLIASRKFMVSLGVDDFLWFGLFWGVVIFYTCWGGLKAVVSTDVIQALFFILILGGCFFASREIDTGVNFFLMESSKWSGWLLMPILFMIIEQDMGQRCFAGKSGKVVSQAAFCAGIVTFIVCLVPIYFGMRARGLNLDFKAGESLLMASVKALTNEYAAALMGAAIMAAIISTADSLINAIGSNLSLDFDFFKNKGVRTSQVLTGVIASFGVYVSLYFTNIVDVLMLSYELLVSCIFVPIFMALLKRKGNAVLSIIVGASCFVLFKWIPIPLREVVTLAFSFAGFFIRSKSMEEVL